MLRSTRRSRLLADTDVFEHDLRRRVGDSKNCGDLRETWAREACEQLESARAAVRGFDTERAWVHLEAARRATILGYGQDELRLAAMALREEAVEKVASWRGNAIAAILGDMPPLGQDLSDQSLTAARLALRDATLIRDEDFRNEYRRITLVRRRLVVLILFLLATAGALLAFQAWWPITLDAAPGLGGRRIWAYVVAWGVLGGSFSAVLSVIRGSLRGRVPVLIREGVITGIRPLFGAAGALAAYVLVEAGTLGIEVSSNAAVFAVSFAAGFSEALIVRAVGAALSEPGSKSP